MAKKRMPLYGIIGIFKDFLTHTLAKYQYFSMRQVYSFSTINIHIRCLFRLNISLNVGLWPKNPKNAQNRPYLSLKLLPNCCHQKSFTPFIFQYFGLKFWIWLLN